MARVLAKVDQNVLKNTRQFIAALQNEGLRVQRAYLYGSQAQGTARDGSDIDIAIVARNLSGNWHRDFVRLNILATQIDSRMEVVGYIPKTFRDESPLVWEIKTTGISLLRNGKNGKRRAAPKKRAPRKRARA